MLLTWGTVFAIFLSFIGMYALSAYSVEKRIKEIGVRKVLGSSSKEVMLKRIRLRKYIYLFQPLSNFNYF